MSINFYTRIISIPAVNKKYVILSADLCQFLHVKKPGACFYLDSELSVYNRKDKGHLTLHNVFAFLKYFLKLSHV